MPETTTKAKPILFSAPMVNAILAGTKVQTRRVINPQPEISKHGNLEGFWMGKPIGGLILPKPTDLWMECKFGKPGDILYVKESLRNIDGKAHYDADKKPVESLMKQRWPWTVKYLTGRFMPPFASRITLEITDVRVQRVRDISEEDAKAEGIRPIDCGGSGPNHWTDGTHNAPTAKEVYRELWGSISGWDSWDANPWCWCISFRRITNA